MIACRASNPKTTLKLCERRLTWAQESGNAAGFWLLKHVEQSHESSADFKTRWRDLVCSAMMMACMIESRQNSTCCSEALTLPALPEWSLVRNCSVIRSEHTQPSTRRDTQSENNKQQGLGDSQVCSARTKAHTHQLGPVFQSRDMPF